MNTLLRLNKPRLLSTRTVMTFSGRESAIEPRKLSENPGSIWESTNDEIIRTPTPSVLSLPSRYIQGIGTIHNIGKYVKNVEPQHNRVAIVIDKLCYSLFHQSISDSFNNFGLNEPFYLEFGEECSFEEVERLYTILSNKNIHYDTIMAVGGGKALDTGKLLRHYIPNGKLINIPTIVSTDAPCTALSVVYTEDHQVLDVFFYPKNADLIVVDEEIIATAPVRYFTAGIGDALSTFYEAKTVFDNQHARSLNGARVCLAAVKWAEMARDLLFEYGIDAKYNVEQQIIGTLAVNRCIEANVLSSGTGAESCGLGVAHSFATSISNVQRVHDEYMHGEHVSVGLIAHLLVEKEFDEALKVGRFCKKVGLPICCDDIGWKFEDESNKKEADEVVEFACGLFASNHKTNVTKDMLWMALAYGNKLQQDLSQEI